MKMIIRLTIILLAGIMVQILSSCKHEGDYDHADITVTYSCTKDLLDFFIPVIKITNSDGHQQNITLSKEDFREYGNKFSLELDNNTTVEIPVYYCSITEKLQGLQGYLHMTVEYMPLPEQEDGNLDNVLFADGISKYSVNVSCQKGHSINHKEETFSIDGMKYYDQLFHLYVHKTILFDFTYNIITTDDDVIFDGQCDISIGTHDHVLTSKNK